MPIIKDVMRSLVKQYGPEKGKNVYYAMENSGKLDKARKTAAKKKNG